MKPDLSCLIVPISNGSLIFPENMLAEALTIEEISNPVDQELITWVEWSRRRIPIVSFEQLCNNQAELKPIRRIVVMHTVVGDERLPFVALQAEGIPHPVKINESLLQESAIQVDCPYVACYVQVSNLPCTVPDWPRVEELVLEHY